MISRTIREFRFDGFEPLMPIPVTGSAEYPHVVRIVVVSVMAIEWCVCLGYAAKLAAHRLARFAASNEPHDFLRRGYRLVSVCWIPVNFGHRPILANSYAEQYFARKRAARFACRVGWRAPAPPQGGPCNGPPCAGRAAPTRAAFGLWVTA